MAIINETFYDIQDLSVLNLGHLIREEFLKAGERYLKMTISDSEAVQIAFDEISNDSLYRIPAETMEETIQQGVEAAFEESGEIVSLESCYIQNEFLLHGIIYR